VAARHSFPWSRFFARAPLADPVHLAGLLAPSGQFEGFTSAELGLILAINE